MTDTERHNRIIQIMNVADFYATWRSDARIMNPESGEVVTVGAYRKTLIAMAQKLADRS